MEAARERARRRYALRCGYCGVLEDQAGATLTIDHHRPRTRQGGDDDENTVYCCPRCNEHKGSYWHETDLPHIPLLHPLRDDLTMHIGEGEDGRLVGLTREGMFFIQRLRLNRPQLVAYRLHQRSEQNLRQELDAMRHRVNELQQLIAELDHAVGLTQDAIESEMV